MWGLLSALGHMIGRRVFEWLWIFDAVIWVKTLYRNHFFMTQMQKINQNTSKRLFSLWISALKTVYERKRRWMKFQDALTDSFLFLQSGCWRQRCHSFLCGHAPGGLKRENDWRKARQECGRGNTAGWHTHPFPLHSHFLELYQRRAYYKCDRNHRMKEGLLMAIEFDVIFCWKCRTEYIFMTWNIHVV